MEFNKENIFNKVKAAQQTKVVMDEGLRAYMLKVYNYMCTGLFLTGIVSLIVFKAAGGYDITWTASGYTGVTSFGNFLLNTGFMWVVALSPLAVIFYFRSAASKMNVVKCQTAFWIFSSLFGASLSTLLVHYTGISIARVFFITAGTLAQ